jgi:hypothetical protein
LYFFIKKREKKMVPWAKRGFLVAWFAVQIALPARYYLATRYVDPLDEMYAWRMFSDTFHGASEVEWYRFDGDADAGVLVDKAALVRDAGLSRKWASAATGVYGSRRRLGRLRTRAPDLDMMQRIGEHLCRALAGTAAAAAAGRNLTAIGAVRSGTEWASDDVWQQEYMWDC